MFLGASQLGARMFRNNVGVGWVGKIIKRTHTEITLANPRVLHAGLGLGTSDGIGIRPVTITREMVGTVIGQFVAAEIKVGKTPTTADQDNFLKMVNRLGGIGVVVREPDDLLRLLK